MSMQLRASFKKHTLNFKFDAGTSRGVLKTKDTWYLIIQDDKNTFTGIGECGPLKGLSPDDRPDFEQKLQEVCDKITEYNPKDPFDPFFFKSLELDYFPSIHFGLETALLDLFNGGRRIIFPEAFVDGMKSIPINGLVWMGDEDFMMKQVKDKISQGYSCIKMKIGALDFSKELKILEAIRSEYSADKISLRLDANGAFTEADALKKLNLLAKYQIHSIEQPVKAGQEKLMRKLCEESPIPIALDEELIGKVSKSDKKALLEAINPQFIILKPTLLGGFFSSVQWISLAEEKGIGWWITSALESNIGLNAISQFTSTFNVAIPQGLGTGQLYHNNVESPLVIKSGALYYMPSKEWDLHLIFSEE